MILEPKHKNLTGPLQIKETVKKDLISGAKCSYQRLLNATNLRQF
jgi:hypothetical protein